MSKHAVVAEVQYFEEIFFEHCHCVHTKFFAYKDKLNYLIRNKLHSCEFKVFNLGYITSLTLVPFIENASPNLLTVKC